MKWKARFCGVVLALAACAGALAASPPPLRPEVEAFIEEMADRHRFERRALHRVFRQAQPRPDIIRAMSAPATARPWYVFRPVYIEERRIAAGVEFWQRNAAALARAREVYGVPEEIVVATIGVETFYGRNTGRYKVLEALTTLAFDYPRRADLFRAELEEFLLLTRESGLAALQVRGSYAGAMGIPQFLPSSYRRYAVDFDGDGRADLWHSPADAIGSVANYYKTFGWEPGTPVALRASAEGDDVAQLLAAGIKPHATIGELRQRGILPQAPVPEDALAALVVVEAESGEQYWLGLQNFYAITRYNRSVNYALAVYELAREVAARMPPRSSPVALPAR